MATKWYIFAGSDLDALTVSASSEADGFPAENVQNPWRTKHWRSGSIASYTTLKFSDGGASSHSLAFFIMDFCNLQGGVGGVSAILQGNDTDSWTSPTTELTLIDAGTGLWYVIPPATLTHYYWRLVLTDPTNPDGFHRVGRVFGGADIIAWARGLRTNARNVIDPSTSLVTLSGQKIVNARDPFTRYSLRADGMTDAELNTLLQAAKDIGQAPFFIAIPNLVTPGEFDFRYVENVADWSFERAGKNNNNLILELKDSQ